MEIDKRTVAKQRIRTIFDEQLLNHLHRNQEKDLNALFDAELASTTRGGTTIMWQLDELRKEADKVAVKIMDQKFKDAEKLAECRKIWNKYIELISTNEGRNYLKALSNWEQSALSIRSILMQIEHEWNQYSEKHPNFRFPDLPHQWKPLNFWNALGGICYDLFKPGNETEEKFDRIYHYLAQLDPKDRRASRYLELIHAHETLDGFGMHPETHKVSNTLQEHTVELFALTNAGSTLVSCCLYVKKIIENCPHDKVVNNGVVSLVPIYSDVAKAFSELCENLSISAEFKTAIRRAVTHFPELFHPAKKHYTLPGIGDRRQAIYHGHSSSSSS